MQCSICGLAGELVLSASKQHGAHFACCKRVVPDFLLPLSDSKLRQMREKIGLSREIPSADTVKSQVDVRMEAAAPLLLRGDRVFAAQLEKHSRRTWCFRDESKKETPFAPTESKETVSVNSFVAVDSNDPGRPNIASIVSIFHKASMKGSEASISNKNWQLGLRLFVRPEQSQLASTEVNLNEVPLEQTLLQLQPPAETVVALSHVLFKVAVVTRQEYRQILAAHHDEDRVHPHPAVRFFDSFEKRRVFCCHRSCSLGVFLGRTPSDKCVLGPLARFSSSFQKTQKLRLRRAAKDARMPAKSVPGRISRKQLRQKVKVSTSWRRQWDAVFSAVFDAATLKRLRVLMRALINVDTTSAMEKRYLQLNCTNLADTPQHETHAVSGTHKGHVSDSQLFSAVAKRVGLQRPSRATAHSLCDTYNIDHKLASTLWTVAADFPLAALQEYLSHLLQEQQDRKLPQQTLGASVMQDSDEEFELPEQRRQRAQREQQRKQRQLERQHKLALEKRWADEIDGDVLLRRCDLATGEAEKGDCLALLNAFLSHTLSGLNNYQFGKVTDDTAARKHLSEIGVMQVIARACSHVCRWLHVPSSTSTVQTPSAMLLVAACADTLVTVLRAVTCPTRSTDTLDAMLARHDPNKPVERNDSEIDVIRSIQETRECLQLRQMPSTFTQEIAQPDVVVKKRVALLSGEKRSKWYHALQAHRDAAQRCQRFARAWFDLAARVSRTSDQSVTEQVQSDSLITKPVVTEPVVTETVVTEPVKETPPVPVEARTKAKRTVRRVVRRRKKREQSSKPQESAPVVLPSAVASMPSVMPSLPPRPLTDSELRQQASVRRQQRQPRDYADPLGGDYSDFGGGFDLDTGAPLGSHVREDVREDILVDIDALLGQPAPQQQQLQQLQQPLQQQPRQQQPQQLQQQQQQPNAEIQDVSDDVMAMFDFL